MASAMDPNQDPGYIRPLDRTPETDQSNISKLSDDDRRKIYGLRSAFSNTFNKLNRLEESNEEKELIIERERELRKNLEKKLMETKLVDMYSNPAVNEELHDRLPRASKERMYAMYGTPRSSRRKHKKKKGRSSDEELSAVSDDESVRKEYKHNHTYPGGSMHPSFYTQPGMFGWPPGFMFPSPFTHHSTPNPASATPGPAGAPFQPMTSSYWPHMNNTQNNGAEVNGSAVNPQQQGMQQPGDVNVIKAASMLSSESKERQIARLIHEIDLLKDQNRKISDELTEQLTECNRLRVEAELREAANEEKSSSKVSALIQEIYDKQKQRDRAMMGRLKLANEERDRALTMMNSLKQGHTMAEILSDNEDGEERITPPKTDILSSLNITQRATDVLDAIHGTTLRSREGHSHRVKELTQECDSAQNKVGQLESELLSLQREVDELLPLQDEHLKVKRQLSMTQQEREVLLNKLKALEDENTNLKIYYGLHKSLSKEQSWKEQYNNSLNQMQQVIAQRDGSVIDAQKETNKLQEVIQELADERDTLRQSLEKFQLAEKEHQRTNEKLQRHVSVLQKKLKKISHSDLGTV